MLSATLLAGVFLLTAPPSAARVAAAAPELAGPVVAVDEVPFLNALYDPSATAGGSEAHAAQLRQVASIPAHRVAIAAESRHFVMDDDPAFLFASIDEFLGHRGAGCAAAE